jgi:hypothetical protein
VSPRPAIFYTIAFFILLPIYLWDRPTLKPVSLKDTQESLLKLDSIDTVGVARGTETLKFQKTSDQKLFQVVDPQGKFIPQDLMNALVQLLVTQKQVEVVAENSNDLKQFGLDQPTAVLTVQGPGQAPIKISFGAENPTHTAVYAQIEGRPQVFLLGKNLEYYETLMFQWIEGKQGKNA